MTTVTETQGDYRLPCDTVADETAVYQLLPIDLPDDDQPVDLYQVALNLLREQR